ncbi:hypothetical protein HPT27_00850 [Permianibacter sp. IMCC34836]|uniref:ApeI family dehydratase n=1 Tax=Permianibacter fluminis TaxID=2738515 RepID=UPI001552DBF5|nr:hypothetical protein [Permianibacter fluminis]NQD35549.1 hypothetical protein [Permianibacter fluminis]
MTRIAAVEKLPSLIQTEQTAAGLVLTLNVPASLVYFPGHFPMHAILPGVVQIDWATHFGRRHFGFTGRFQKMEALKFQAIIEPQQQIQLTLDYRAATGKLLFSYDSERGRHSSGRIVFADPAATSEHAS